MQFNADNESHSSLLFASSAFCCVMAAVVWTKRSARQNKSAKCAEEPFIHPSEACIIETNNVLVALSVEQYSLTEFVNAFCGAVVSDPTLLPDIRRKSVYLCGDISKATSLLLSDADRIFIIKEHSYDFENVPSSWRVVDSGRVPLLVHGVGVYYRRFFDSESDLFNKLRSDHSFQSLTESNKPGTAYRTGIYLTPVVREGDGVHFNLLRCSSNLSGPTGNFRANDRAIVDALNQESAFIFQNSAPLNHVLAQIYHNTAAAPGKKEIKAKIKDHSDKTKDMPRNGIMAFCTFYDGTGLARLQRMGQDGLDYGFKGVSGLTRLHFRLKPELANRPDCRLSRDFSVTLYPDSVFLMSLSTNRMYTHEIRPGALNAELLPTRMGYVVRCSNAGAVHIDGTTYIKLNGELVPMQAPNSEMMTKLRLKYAEENASAKVIEYDEVLFSMNKGDYEKPIVYDDEEVDSDGFQLFHIESVGGDIYTELLKSVEFEDVCQGRKGAVIVKPDELRGIPIVRTTTKYSRRGQCFKPLHYRLVDHIQRATSLPISFNNALIEYYNNSYATMGFHSDQALDLEDDSYVAVFSCYANTEMSNPPRKLIVEPKVEGGKTFEIPMPHNSVIVFSMKANKKFRHKIVLESSTSAENPWIGVTFRLSKTFVNFNGNNYEACFEDGTPFFLANSEQRSEFYKQRKLENQELNFLYGNNLHYTISESDLLPPT